MGNENNIYECPRGCKSQGERPIAASIRGWKKHMTRQHAGYSDEELAAISGQASIINDGVNGAAPGPGFDGFAARVTGEGDGSAASEISGGVAPNASPETVKPVSTVKTDAAAKKLNAKFVKLQKKLAEILPATLDKKLRESQGDSWALDEDEKEMLSDSIESVFDMIGVEFQIEMMQLTLTSVWWVLLYPVAVFGLVFGMKAFKNAKKAGEDGDSPSTD